MAFECPVCYEKDMDGKILQCYNGHAFCESCYTTHANRQQSQDVRALCPTCREKLSVRDPIRSLQVEQAIAAKKQAIMDEVQQEAEAAEQLEVVQAVAAEDAREAHKADEAARAVALAAGDDVSAQEELLHSVMVSRNLATTGEGEVNRDPQAQCDLDASVLYYCGQLQHTLASAELSSTQRVSMSCAIIESILSGLSFEDRLSVRCRFSGSTLASAVPSANERLQEHGDVHDRVRAIIDIAAARARSKVDGAYRAEQAAQRRAVLPVVPSGMDIPLASADPIANEGLEADEDPRARVRAIFAKVHAPSPQAALPVVPSGKHGDKDAEMAAALAAEYAQEDNKRKRDEESQTMRFRREASGLRQRTQAS